MASGTASEYLHELSGSAPAKNQALAALRHFCDALVQRHALLLGSSHQAQHYRGQDGRDRDRQERRFLATLDTSQVLGLRDRAVLGVLAHTGARVGVVATLRLSDDRNLGTGCVLRFRKKGGKEREMSVRHDLAGWIDEYLAAAKAEGQQLLRYRKLKKKGGAKCSALLGVEVACLQSHDWIQHLQVAA